MKYLKMVLILNYNSLKRIEETTLPSGKWISLEIAQDLIYLHFNNVELGNPKYDKDLPLSIRFAQNSFISFFYNDIWDIDFISNYDFTKNSILENFSFKIKSFKFLDFQFLNQIFSYYDYEKTLSLNPDIDVHNIRNDFFLIFGTDKLSVVVGGDSMDFYNRTERLDDDTLKELSNQWVLYYLDYWSSKRIKKDLMCEKHPFK